MYIEERIEKLEHLVKTLQATVLALQEPIIVVQDQPKAKTPSKQAEEKADNLITAAEVQAKCLTLVRANPANKDIIKKILHGKMVKEIDPSHYPEMMIELNELGEK